MRSPNRRSWYAFALALCFVLAQVTLTLAGTTGSLTGTVLDQDRGAIAGATVSATSPSQNARATTDANGKFAFASLAPDTYTVTIEKAGYDSYSLTGVTIQADQTQSYPIGLNKKLTQIGRVASRRSNDLIKPGTTVDVYSISPAQQVASSALGGGGGLNSAYSAIASVPGVFVPQGQRGIYQSVFVRGGNYTQLGYEYDGVPIQRAFDAYPAQNLGTIGQQELQIYTGGAPVGSGATGLAGYVNQVIKTGTYPGTGSVNAGLASPFYYRSLTGDYGATTPNRRFSYYAGASAYNQTFVYERGNEYSSKYGTPTYALAQNCGSAAQTGGCYKLFAPNSYELGPIFYGGNGLAQFSRENVVNLHYKIPRKDNQDDIQLLYNTQYFETTFSETLRDLGQVGTNFGSGTATFDGTGTVPTCTFDKKGLIVNQPCGAYQGAGTAPNYGGGFFYKDKVVYGGPLGTALTAADLGSVRTSYFPNSPVGRPFNGLIDPNSRPSYQQDTAIVKLQYQRNLSSRAYLRLYGYTQYSDWLQYDPVSNTIGATGLYGTISSDYKLGTHTRGVALQFADQMSDKHLFNLNLGYTTATTFRNNNAAITLGGALGNPLSSATSTVAFLVDSTNPTGGICYGSVKGVIAPVNCGSANSSRYVISQTPGTGLVLAHKTDPTVGAAGTLICGGGPCEYLSVANGIAASYNTVRPQFATLSLQDTWTPSAKLTITAGVRYDDFKYQLPDTSGGIARQFFVNYYNANNCFDPLNKVVVAGKAANDCAARGFQQLAFSSKSGSSNDYPELQPRIGATYSINPLNVLRFSASKAAQPANTSYQQYDTLAPNIVPSSSALLFYPLGFNTPQHHVYPEESYGIDGSWEHQAKGTDLSWKLSPYFRQSKNEITTLVLDPVTSFVSGVNAGSKFVKGIEFAVRKGSLERDGWFGSLSYTYTNAKIVFSKVGNNVSVVDPLNVAIRQYNAYTAFCASNAADPRCITGTAGGVPVSFTSPGKAAAAPCYTADGTADPTCKAGSVGNPYWNAPVQGLLDPGARYEVYSRYSSSALNSGSNQSYISPHVAALVLNYKRGPLNVTPTFQFQAGARYGRPLSTPGADPAAGCKPLPGSAAADPRYQNGAPGGQPYDAATCTGFINVPDPYVGHFDNYGQFREPNVFAGNLSVSYDFSKSTKLSLIGVNLLTACSGGSNVPWRVTGRLGCNYGAQSGAYVGNLYNNGDRLDPVAQYPYLPTFASGVTQSGTGGQAQYAQFFVTLSHKI